MRAKLFNARAPGPALLRRSRPIARVASPTTEPSQAASQPISPPTPQGYYPELAAGTFTERPPILGRDPMILTAPNSDAVSMRDILRGGGQAGTNGQPRFFSPVLSPELPSQNQKVRAALPLMFYLPGIDGLGLAASRQFPRLQQGFDLRSLFIPPDNRDDFPTLVRFVEAYIQQEIAASPDPTRPVYLLGESFGGILAIQCALELGPETVHRVVLVNPATSFVNAPWSSLGPLLTNLPPELYKNLPFALSPILSNPLGLAAYALQQQLSASAAKGFSIPNPVELAASLNSLAQGLLQLLPSLGALSDILPPATLAWKLDLLAQGCTAVNPNLAKVQQRTLALFSDFDLLIPSLEEARRYRRSFPRARVQVLGGRGHALLQEGGVDLMAILSEQGFYQARRVLSAPPGFKPTVAAKPRRPPPTASPAAPEETQPQLGERDEASRPAAEGLETPADSAAAAAAQAAPSKLSSSSSSSSSSPRSAPTSSASSPAYRVRPLDLPTRKELAFQSDDTNIALFRKATSPVFFSTSPEGRVERGLGQVPTHRRPVLLIGNHQLWAPDLGLIITEFLEEKSTLPRGLAHPAIFNDFGNAPSSSSAAQRTEAAERAAAGARQPAPFGGQLAGIMTEGNRRTRGQGQGGAGGAGSLSTLFTQFGAVPVSAKNFYRLLQQGETILLFPGGVREAYKRRDEKYKLFWPAQAEFVRMAARFGATIVPFAAVGAEDGVDILLDSEQLKQLPFIGERVRSSSQQMPRARRGAAADNYSEFGAEGEEFIAPLIVPNSAPDRFYFKFAAPIELTGSEGKAECDAVYKRVRDEVEGGLAWLQQKREMDRFRKFENRILFESSSGRQAPTFDI